MSDFCPLVTASEVPDAERLSILPKLFGTRFFALEQLIYNYATELCLNYRGGRWSYFKLSNGGFYMAPMKYPSLLVSVASNGFEGTVSAEVGGIIACLFAINRLNWATRDPELARHFYLLREFACEHEHSRQILRAID